MSHIAAALAKSKGKNVPPPSPEGLKDLPALRIGPPASPIIRAPGQTLPPFQPKPAPVVAAPPPPAAAVAGPASPKRGVLIAVVSVVLLVAGASAWLLFKPASASALFASPPAPVPAATPVKVAPAAIAPVRKGPSAELTEKIRVLPITAAAGGGSQRLSVSGKVYEPGDTVVEGLVLQSIETEEIVFRDTEGNLYTRRL